MLNKANIEPIINNLIMMGQLNKEEEEEIYKNKYNDYYDLKGCLENNYCINLENISIKDLEKNVNREKKDV